MNKGRQSILDMDPKTLKKEEAAVKPEDTQDETIDKKEEVDDEVDDEDTAPEDTQDVHLNTDDTDDDDVQPDPEDKKFGDFWAHASETLGKEVSKFEDLFIEKEVEKIVEKEVIKETEYASEFAKRYDKFFKETNGRPVEDFLAFNVDPSKLSDEEIIKRSIKYNNPNFDQADIDGEFDDFYTIDDDIMDETEINRKNRARKKAINKGVREIESLKQDFFVPLEKPDAQADKVNEEAALKLEENRKLWREAVEGSTSEFKGIDIKISDNFSFTQKASQEDLSYVKDVVSDDSFSTYLKRYDNGDGKLDTKKMIEDHFFLKNKESIIAEVIKQAKAEERGEIIKQDKHIDFKSSKKKPGVSKLTKRQQEVRDLVAAKFKKRL